MNPSGPGTPPRIPKQPDRVNWPGFVLWLVLVLGSVGITLSVAEHCRGTVKAAFAPVVDEAPPP